MHYSRIQSLTLDVLSTSELLVRGFPHLGGGLASAGYHLLLGVRVHISTFLLPLLCTHCSQPPSVCPAVTYSPPCGAAGMQGALGSDDGTLAAPPQGPLPPLTDLSYERGSPLGAVDGKILCGSEELPSPG